MKKFKSYVAGILTGVILTSLPVLASTVKQMIEVELNTINITVDGKKVEADNFLYNDRTYVPLRAMAEMIGKNVDWDEATNTAIISDVYGVTYSGDVVGSVNGIEIKSEQLETYKNIASKLIPGATQEEIVAKAKERIVYDAALADFSKKFGVVIGEEFETVYANFVKNIEAIYPDYIGLLASLGYTEKAWKQDYMTEYLKNRVLSEASASFSVSDDEILSYYNENKETFRYDGLKAKHILFSTLDENGQPLSDSKIASVKKTADNVYTQIKRGTDFDKLMNQYSEDPGLQTAPDGYIFTKGDMVKEFEDAAYALEVGKVSEPVKSQYGYHIIKLIEKVEFLPIENAKENIVTAIKNIKLDAEIKRIALTYTAQWK